METVKASLHFWRPDNTGTGFGDPSALRATGVLMGGLGWGLHV